MDGLWVSTGLILLFGRFILFGICACPMVLNKKSDIMAASQRAHRASLLSLDQVEVLPELLHASCSLFQPQGTLPGQH